MVHGDEQVRLFNALPRHLRRMALFKVNTGCRQQEVCQLRWDWEIKIPELNTSVFIVPAWMNVELSCGKIEKIQLVKNGEDRLIVLNDFAKSVIEEVRGIHQKFVFTYEYKKGHHRPVEVINNSAWKRARNAVGLPQVRVHDLKHTFGQRLRAVGVSREDRKDLLGHKSREITLKSKTLSQRITPTGNIVHLERKI